jgi:hypothetical protein
MKEFLKLSAVELEQASAKVREAAAKADYQQIAAYFGSPDDPELPSETDALIAKVCQIAPNADAMEPLFYFQTAEKVKQVYTLSRGGTVTNIDIVPDEPSAITWSKNVSPARSVELVDINNAKFDVFARETKCNEEAMDRYELGSVLNLLWAACPDDQRFALDSSKTYLDFPKLLQMIAAVSKYGKKFVLFVGSDVNVDLLSTDYNENKNQSVIAMIEKLGIEIIPIIGQYRVASSTKNLLDADRAMLVAVDGVNGKPAVYGRKNLVANTVIGGTITPKQRYSSVVPVIPRNGEAPKASVWGYGEFQAVVTNTFPIACFGDTIESV